MPVLFSIDGMGLDQDKFEATDAQMDDDTTKNVGDLNVLNAVPVSFNHLTGSFTEALTSTGAGGADQTASWGGTPIVRPAVMNTANGTLVRDADDDADTNSDYQMLNGLNEVDTPQALAIRGGRLAEKDAGGGEMLIAHDVEGYVNAGGNSDDEVIVIDNAGGDSNNPQRMQRGLNDGALVLPALYGGGDESLQIMLMLSATDEFGGAGKYSLMPAKTGYMVSLMDSMGDALPDPSAADGPVFGGADDPETPPGTKIIVEGIRVMVDAGKCDGTMLGGESHAPWQLSSLTSIIPSAMSGTKDFDGLDAMLTAEMNASPGWIKFMRYELECEKDFGDTTPAGAVNEEGSDGVPITDKRTLQSGHAGHRGGKK